MTPPTGRNHSSIPFGTCAASGRRRRTSAVGRGSLGHSFPGQPFSSAQLIADSLRCVRRPSRSVSGRVAASGHHGRLMRAGARTLKHTYKQPNEQLVCMAGTRAAACRAGGQLASGCATIAVSGCESRSQGPAARRPGSGQADVADATERARYQWRAGSNKCPARRWWAAAILIRADCARPAAAPTQSRCPAERAAPGRPPPPSAAPRAHNESGRRSGSSPSLRVRTVGAWH
jgi:hypothetical protein